MSDFADVTNARNNAVESIKNVTARMEELDPRNPGASEAIATLTAATAICMFLHSLEIALDCAISDLKLAVRHQ